MDRITRCLTWEDKFAREYYCKNARRNYTRYAKRQNRKKLRQKLNKLDKENQVVEIMRCKKCKAEMRIAHPDHEVIMERLNMDNPIAYVSGPYSADSNEEQLKNIFAARNLAKKLWKRGYAVICPHSNSGLMDGAVEEDIFLAGYLKILEQCDIVFFLPNWRKSKGAVAEYEHANRCGIRTLVGE